MGMTTQQHCLPASIASILADAWIFVPNHTDLSSISGEGLYNSWLRNDPKKSSFWQYLEAGPLIFSGFPGGRVWAMHCR